MGLNTNGSVKSAVGNKFSGSTGFEQRDQVKVSLKRSLCCFTFWYWETDDLVNNLPQRQQGNKSPLSIVKAPSCVQLMKHEKEVSAHGRNYIFQKSYLPANNL